MAYKIGTRVKKVRGAHIGMFDADQCRKVVEVCLAPPTGGG